MSTVIIIPARFASSRFPGKPLEALRGRDGVSRALIEHTWRAGRAVKDVSALYVATDDTRIAQHCEAFGAQVLMTSSSCRNGTERCAEAVLQLETKPELVVNLQGDAPLTPPWFLDRLIETMQKSPELDAATPVIRSDAQTVERLLEDRKNGRVGATTAVFDAQMRALYFSKEVLPHGKGASFHHVGVYAYRPETLAQYLKWPEGNLECSEGLEQLRFLENGHKMACVEVDPRGHDFWEVNNPNDIPLVEKMMGSSQ